MNFSELPPSMAEASATERVEGTVRSSSDSTASRVRGRRALVRWRLDSHERSQERGDMVRLHRDGDRGSVRPPLVSAPSGPAVAQRVPTFSEIPGRVTGNEPPRTV